MLGFRSNNIDQFDINVNVTLAIKSEFLSAL